MLIILNKYFENRITPIESTNFSQVMIHTSVYVTTTTTN